MFVSTIHVDHLQNRDISDAIHSSDLFRLRFNTIAVPTWVEPEALVLVTKLTGTKTAQKSWYQTTEVAVPSVFLVPDQH